MIACNLPLTLCCIASQCNYLYVHCAVSVTGFTAVDSAHKGKEFNSIIIIAFLEEPQ
jgi:hypothetical protein